MKPTMVEAALRRNRLTLALLLVVLPLACWIWIIMMARDMYGSMTGASAWMMTSHWDVPRLVLLWAMWAAMMAAMMLPSATPFVLLYAGAVRNRAESRSPAATIYALAGGYVLVWAGFSVGATLLHWLLAKLLVLTPMMEPTSPWAAPLLLMIAGLYQLTPLKQACLRSCRSPIGFLGTRWRTGTAGSFRMGVENGVYCVGCCWALMLLLFAGGVMNLWVILTLTAWVAIEKLAPFGRESARVSGAMLLGAAAWMLLKPLMPLLR
jgi:predicted metal-binding membrane protein